MNLVPVTRAQYRAIQNRLARARSVRAELFRKGAPSSKKRESGKAVKDAEAELNAARKLGVSE